MYWEPGEGAVNYYLGFLRTVKKKLWDGFIPKLTLQVGLMEKKGIASTNWDNARTSTALERQVQT